ncbi:MAG: RHS repeat domain-containing protein, partial [Hoylesella buccalis]
SRVKHDGKEDEKATDQKYRWDEENRLLAADENGFVSNYWYDADGERTVKTSGENEAIFVNSEFSGGNTGTARFSLYVSPYLVAGQGGKYTKHIYIGSQRIVSKLGDLASYGADPRRIPYAGNEADGVTVDYKAKYSQQLQSIKDNYKTFDLPYNGVDNTDYVNGKSFSSDDDTPEASQARAMVKTRAGEAGTNERLQFYYHPDHLGSSSYITNLDGEVMQHIEYVPFGEVFIEERNNTWNTPYLFNAKEFDEETGMYYYGARYYEPRLSLWMSVDPISIYDPRNSENYLDGEHNNGVFNAYNLSPYSYCYQNPVKLSDPDGKQVIAVHGTFSSNGTWKDKAGINRYAHKTFGNNSYNYGFKWSGGNYASMRTTAAKQLVQYAIVERKRLSHKEPLTIVGHSHGGNVGIEAINLMVNMPEFDGVQINLLTINTPVRSDYQLSKKALQRVNHINVYDSKDPVQINGGNINHPEEFNIYKEPNLLDGFVGEYGPAGRVFKCANKNISVDNPQPLIKWRGLKSKIGDYHNSHNRVKDWENK